MDPENPQETMTRLVVGWLLVELTHAIRDSEMTTTEEIVAWLVRYPRREAAQRFHTWFHEHLNEIGQKVGQVIHE